ncbi:Acetolactate synthase isozyme 2 small subunit [Candidatus Annandia adelgestsuga]|uniref:Acetolactate synthase isozyme 2 small subunit n=1 Tax=Candidatus Annandia adelgestsuga TaxID=1302411 RepID=A0A3Q9CP20_9ENTR|nr:ACT domain-containing protein [Candidatus Annandia adelgestsuga]AZP36191.1 Acetolactate synthase isozyme 2 small subunit [Candidatus Annandia adelgestsuga]
MYKKKIFIQTEFQPEILERILRILRHRNFININLNYKYNLNINKINIKIILINYKNIDILLYQLKKIIDINIIFI